MIWLFLAIEAAECNVWCISEGYDKGGYQSQVCQCIDEYPYSFVKIKKKKVVKKSEQSEVMEIYEPFDDSPYLKIK